MKNGELINKVGGDCMAVDFNYNRLNFAIREKRCDYRTFRQKFIGECDSLDMIAPSDATINNWLGGKNEPRSGFVRIMASLLGKPMEFFCGGEAG